MRRNKGIALVVALLAGALFLTVILAVVSNLSISTRRLTTDQNLALQAKYAAESGLSMARTQTEAAMYQISYMVSRINLPKNYPFNTSPGSDLLTHVAHFCNVSRSSLPALDTTLANGPGKNDPNVNNLCQFNPGADVTGNNRWSFFTDFIPSDAINDYNNAKDEKTNQLLNTTRQISDPDLKALFNRLFGTGQPQGFKTITTTNGVETGYQLQSSLFTPLGVNARQIGGNWVLTFNFIPTPSTSTGMVRGAGDPTKILASHSLSRSYSNQFKISVTPPSFAQFLQFTDFNTPNGPNSGPADLVWYAPNQLYDGPVHTNDFLAFMANTKDYGAWFGGKVSSAGCVRTTFTADCTPADQKQEVWVRTPTASRLDVTSAIPTYTNPEFADKKDTAGNVIGKDVEWGAKPIDLPTGSSNQESMADQGGILVNASADPPKPTVSGDYNAYPYGNINNMRLWAGKGDNALDGTDFTASDWDPNKNPYKDPDTGETKYAGGWKLNSNYQYIEMVQDVKGYGVCDDPFTGIAITSSKTITASASGPTSQSVVVKITRNPDWQGPIYLDTPTSIPGGGSISGLNTNYDGKGTTSTGASDITVSLPTGWAGPNTTVTIRGTAKMGTGIPPILGGDDTPQTDTLTLNAAPVADFNPSMSNFSLCPGANSNRTLNFGRSNNTRPISVTSWSITSFPKGGSASMVTVTTSPLPTGVAGSSTTLNVAAISTAVPGAYNLRINLTDGVLNKTITVTVTVNTPSVTGSVSNPAVTLNRPVSIPTSNIDGAFVVTVNQSCGTQPVGVRISSTSSLPAGLVIASSLDDTSAPYQFTARIQSGSNVAAGTYPVTYQIYNTSTNAVLFTGTANIRVYLFGYTLSANSLTVPRNSSGTVTVTANRANGHNLAINNIVLTSTLPPGVTVGSGLPGSIPGTGSSTSFTLNVSNTSAPVKDYTISGKGTDTDGTTQTFSFTLNIPTPTYTLSVNPSSFTFRQGESYTINVTATSQNGFSGNVSISLAGLPSGVTSSPPSGTVSITPTTSGTVTFTLTADIAAGMGTFTGSASSGPRAIGSPGPVVAPFTITIAKSGGQNYRPSP
ncbi:MAG: hypothetical protein K6T35_02965, partial [Meiothermus silvanus]|nr:hypothetical protein [Allomeiothermus silvanus]